MRVILLLGSLLLVLLAGCEKLKNSPVDVSHTPLVGRWYGEQISELGDARIHDQLYLQLKADGYVDYHYLSCEFMPGQLVQEKRLDLLHMPVIRLNTVKMVVQNYPLTPKFELTLGAWPDENAGQWVVDNIALQPAADDKLLRVTEGTCQPPVVQ